MSKEHQCATISNEVDTCVVSLSNENVFHWWNLRDANASANETHVDVEDVVVEAQ